MTDVKDTGKTIPGLQGNLNSAQLGAVNGLDSATAALKIAIQSGDKKGARKADEQIRDAYTGAHKVLSKEQVSQLKGEVQEAKFAMDFARHFGGGKFSAKNSKMAGAYLKVEYNKYCRANHLKPSDANFEKFSADIKPQLEQCGMGDKDIDGALAAAKNNKSGFSMMGVTGWGMMGGLGKI